MDAGERLGDDDAQSEVARGDGGVFAGGALPVVVAADDDVAAGVALVAIAAAIGVTPADAVAVGDGANDLDMLAAAGLTWTTEIDGDRRRVFVVVTREARDASGEIHDRMPAFLTRDLWDDWLNPSSLTVDGDAAASKSNRLELLDELERARRIVGSLALAA